MTWQTAEMAQGEWESGKAAKWLSKGRLVCKCACECECARLGETGHTADCVRGQNVAERPNCNINIMLRKQFVHPNSSPKETRRTKWAAKLNWDSAHQSSSCASDTQHLLAMEEDAPNRQMMLMKACLWQQSQKATLADWPSQLACQTNRQTDRQPTGAG